MLRCWVACLVMCVAGMIGAGAEEVAATVTHGPILGRPGPDSMGVWIRASRPARFRVDYGETAEAWDRHSPVTATALEDDLTGWVLLEGLEPGTLYHYRVSIEGPDGFEAGPGGSFRTLPDPERYRSDAYNPRGLFNFSFEYGCGNRQPRDASGPVDLPTYRTMLEQEGEELAFALLNGDWIYEERRDWPVESWRAAVGVSEDETPDVVRFAPTIVGAWENYKLYWDRAPALADWHRRVPSFFVMDDHEIVDDCAGAGTVGLRHRRAVFRDIGVAAWYDYLGWSNPVTVPAADVLGRARLHAGSNVLEDPAADFESIDFDQYSNLHVHWGGPHAGEQGKPWDLEGGDPNAGVYEVVRVIDKSRLEIRPPARADGEAGYSLGRYSYFDFRVSNCHFIVLDTRSQRDLPDNDDPWKKGISMLGDRQKAWMKETMEASDADFLFVVSSVNLMIPHIVDVGEPDFVNYHDGWTAFLEEREEVIDFWDGLNKTVFVLTGDLHTSFVARVTDSVWEMASGPHNSNNSFASTEGNRPPNGPWDSYGRPCDIRWSYYQIPEYPQGDHQRIYCVVQVNNVFNNPTVEGQDRWLAFPRPQVVFRFHDGETGRLMYAESVLAASEAVGE